MTTSDQTPFKITFRLTGDYLQQVGRWQHQCDLNVVRHQITTRGYAMIICNKHHPGKTLDSIAQIPEPGDVIPWYGEISDAYSFYFQPTNDGYHLRVVNGAGGIKGFGQDGGYLWYPEAFPPFNLDVIEPIQIEMETPEHIERTWCYPSWPDWWCNGDEGPVDEVLFEIDLGTLQRFTEWGWSSANIDQCIYRFLPTTVGCEIFLIRQETSEERLFTSYRECM